MSQGVGQTIRSGTGYCASDATCSGIDKGVCMTILERSPATKPDLKNP